MLPQRESHHGLWHRASNFLLHTYLQVPHLKIFFIISSVLTSPVHSGDVVHVGAVGRKGLQKCSRKAPCIRVSEELAQLCKAGKSSFHRNCLQGGQKAWQKHKAVFHLPLEYYLFILPPQKSLSQPSLNTREIWHPGSSLPSRFRLQGRSRLLSAWVQGVCKAVQGWPGVSVSACQHGRAWMLKGIPCIIRDWESMEARSWGLIRSGKSHRWKKKWLQS